MEATLFDVSLISEMIARGMQLIGKNAFSSWISKNMVQISDSIWCSRIRRKQFSGGSSSEGTTTSASDVDKMIVEPNITVLMTSKPPEKSQVKNYFFADSSKSNYGYVRLLPINPEDMQHEVFGNFTNLFKSTPVGQFLSCDKFVDHIASLASMLDKYPNQPYRHGPCITIDHLNIHGFDESKGPSGVIETDAAFALECYQWPEESREWFTRQRKHNWPNQQLIDKIRQQSCHVVPVGDPKAEFPDLEWRLSFLLGERELIWSFNDTQILCYVILKNLRKKFIDPVAPDQISSYHLKTIIFWLSEEDGLSIWTDGNLIICLQKCLSYLCKCIESGHLQHYFYRQNNLFRHKLKSSLERGQVMDTINKMKNETVVYVLDGGLSENCKVYKAWLRCRGNIKRLTEICLQDVEMTTYFPLCKKVNDTRRMYQAVFNTCLNITNCLDSADVLNRISEEFENNLPNDVDQIYLRHIKCFIDIREGITLYRYALREQETEDAQRNLEKKFVDGAIFNELTGKLYLATFYLQRKMYSECRELVNSALFARKRYLYFGHCSTKPGLEIGLTGGKVEQTIDMPVTGEEDEVICSTFDILFSREDLDFVPYPLKFECALFPQFGERVFLLHPCIYAYTLLYFAYFFERDEQPARNILQRMKEVVVDSGFTHQRYRALNVLGHCFSLSGMLEQAVTCYVQSLCDTRSRPHISNAAAYHLAVLAFGVYTMKMKT